MQYTKSMMTDKSPLSFGRYLKAVRLEKGINLQEVSGETKIGMDTLLLIENEDLDRLPAEVFVKGFLRAYAKAVGADSDEAVRRYLSSLRVFQKAARFEADLVRSSTEFWPRLLFSLGALVCLMVLSVWIMSIFQPRPPVNHSSFQPVAEESTEIEAPTVLQATDPAKKPSENIAKRFSLKIVTVKETWMKVIIDGQNPKEYSLNPGDHLELEAISGFNLLIGNAAGIKLTLNDKPVAVPGKNGQVATVQIP